MKPCRHAGPIKGNGDQTDIGKTKQFVRRPKPYKKRYSTTGPISEARLKGERAEKVVLRVLKKLIKNGTLPPAVNEVRRYPSNSPEDKAGYDIDYMTDVGRIDLQVKSSWRSREKFLYKHPEIICIVVEDLEDENVVADQLIEDVWSDYQKLEQSASQ